MKTIRNIGVIAIIIVLALATMGGGHPDDDPSDPDPSPGDVVVSEGTFVETEVSPEGQVFETSDPFGQKTETSDPTGVTVFTLDTEAAVAAQDYLADVDLDIDQNYDAVAKALGDVTSFKDVSLPLSKLALTDGLVKEGELVVQALANLQASDIDADAVQKVYLLPTAKEYQDLAADKAQKTLGLILGTEETLAEIELNITITSKDANYLGLVDSIAKDGGLVEAAAANILVDLLGNILSPDNLADVPLTDDGLKNLVNAATEPIADAFADYAVKQYADYGLGEFTVDSVDVEATATVFDTLDYKDVPAIEANPLALQLYG